MELTKCKLGELITQRREKNDGSDLPICGVSKDGLIPPKQKDADTSIYNVFYRDDFIFNPARMELNSIAINDMYDRAICSSLYEVFYVHRTDLLLPHYLELIIRQKWFTRYCKFLGQGSAREYCRFGNISEIEIEFPPIEEQQKIVEYNTAIENRIALKQKINDNLFSSATAALREIYSDESNLGEAVTLDSYCSQIVSGGTPSRTVDSFWTPATIPWLKNGEVKNNIIISTEECISEEGLAGSSARVVPKYTVNMAMYCVSDIQVSLSCIPLSTNQAVLNLSTDSFRKACFLYYLLTAFGNDITSQANGSAQQNLSKEKIASFVFRSPKLEKQAFDFLETSMRYRIMLTKEISVLLDLQSSMLSLLSR